MLNSGLIYLGALGHPDAVPTLLSFSAVEQARSTRKHALAGLRHSLRGGKVPARVVEVGFPYLDDPDFGEFVPDPSSNIITRSSRMNDNEDIPF